MSDMLTMKIKTWGAMALAVLFWGVGAGGMP